VTKNQHPQRSTEKTRGNQLMIKEELKVLKKRKKKIKGTKKKGGMGAEEDRPEDLQEKSENQLNNERRACISMTATITWGNHSLSA